MNNKMEYEDVLMRNQELMATISQLKKQNQGLEEQVRLLKEDLGAQVKSLEEEVVWWTHAAFSWKAEAEDKPVEQVQDEWFQKELAKYPVIDIPGETNG
jgi:hypothetical protein